jgi:hypothetical protein
VPKEAVPIAKDAVNDGTQVELGTKSVKHHSTINARGNKGSLVDLKGMGALLWLHCGVNDGVHLYGYLDNLNGLEGPEDKHIVPLWSGVTRHGDGRRQ